VVVAGGEVIHPAVREVVARTPSSTEEMS